MTEAPEPERSVKARKEIQEIVDSRISSYGEVRLTTAFVKVGGEWKHYLTKCVVLHKNDTSENKKRMTYENLLLFESRISIQEFQALLSAAGLTGSFLVPGNPSVPVEGCLQRYPAIQSEYISSQETVFNLEWPANLFLFIPTKGYQGGSPAGPFAEIDQPLFDSGQLAIDRFFGIQVSYISWLGSVLIILPNFSARIDQITLGSNKITLAVAAVEGTQYSDLLVKLYLESPAEIEHKDVELQVQQTEIPFEHLPSLYLIYLFSKKTRRVLDFRRFGAGWPTSVTGVKIETTPENVEQIIARGENKQVEFKLTFPKKWDEFAETAVAMANGDGGTIFLGVDDNGSVVGVEDPKIADSIHDALRNLCDPSIEPEITLQQIQGKTVGVIQFKQGSFKPYVLKSRGVYVRVGSTDRIASRDEIVRLAIVNRGNPPFSGIYS